MLASSWGRFNPSPDPYFVDRDGPMNLTQKMLDCVAFIGIRNKKDEFEPRATAFFVRITQDQHKFDHLVTAADAISLRSS